MLVKGNQTPSRLSSLTYALFATLFGIGAGLLINYFDNPAYVLVGLASLIGFVVTIASTEFGLLLLVFITYTRFSDIVVHDYNAPSIAKSFIVLLIITIVIHWAISAERPRGLFLPTLMVVAYGLVGFTSLLYAPDKDAVMYSLSNYVKDALIAIVVVALLKRPHQFRNVIYTLLVIGLFIGSISVHQYVTRNFRSTYGGFAVAEYMNIVGPTNDYRLSGPVGDPNFFAQVMVVLALLGVERLVHDKSMVIKILAALCAAASALTVVFTFSRGATVALALSLLVFFWIYRLKPIQIVAIIAFGVVVLLFAPPTYFQRVLSMKDILPTSGGEINVYADRAIQGRASENLTAWLMVTRHPFLGVGLNNFQSLYQEYTKSLGLAPSASNRSPHNLYLEVAAETGFVGLVVFLLMVGFAFRSIFYAIRKFREIGMDDYSHMATGFAIAFAGYMFAAIFVHAAYPRYFYLLLGISYALPIILDRLQTEQENRWGQPILVSSYEPR
jgi:putative inorganic carbon (HCO3(-)) transporter